MCIKAMLDVERGSVVKVSRDPSDVRGGEPLRAAVDVYLVAAHGAAFRRLAACCGPECTQKHAMLANGVKRNPHRFGLSVPADR
jgi:hypothetical protein